MDLVKKILSVMLPLLLEAASFAQTPPTITIQPANKNAQTGSNAAFRVTVSGTGPLSYQWRINGTNLPNHVISTVAGNGLHGFSGDGGTAINAGLTAFGPALDGLGNLFIADRDNNRVRKVDTNGIISTVAGNGVPGYSGDGGQATSAELSAPAGVAVDGSGDLFIADANNDRVRKVGADGVISTVAGNGSTGSYGDGGLATAAAIGSPAGVAVDASGNLFIADSPNHTIRKVDLHRIITTVAGNGVRGYGGDGGVANRAELNAPAGVAADGLGALFIADTSNQRVRRVAVNGIISTMVGNGLQGYFGDGGAAASARLAFPTGVAIDGLGNLFIADSINQRIRKVGSNGIITTFAGNGTPGYSGDSGAAVNATLDAPSGVAVDALGNLYIADSANARIRKVGVFGPVLEVSNAGAGNAGKYDVVVTGPFGSVTSIVAVLAVGLAPSITTQPTNQTAELGSPITLSVAAGGTAPLDYQWYLGGSLVEGQTNNTLEIGAAEAINTNGYEVVVTSAFGSVTSSVAVLTLALPAGQTFPQHQTVRVGGDATFTAPPIGTGPFLYQWQFNGTNLPNVISTLAGTGEQGYSGDGGAATRASICYPGTMAVDAAGNVFLADTGNNRVRRVGTNGIITTVAGNGIRGYKGDGGPATNASLTDPATVAVDGAGNLFIADYHNPAIRRVGINGVITTFAGTGKYGFSGDGGAATNAELAYPSAVAVDGAGNVYIADNYNERIRRVGTNGVITTIAGNGTYGYSGDGGPATNAALAYPAGVAVDGAGNVFIGDSNNHRIRKVGLNGVITTVAGSGSAGYAGDGGAAIDASLYYPRGVAVDGFGKIFIGDSNNERVRAVGLDGIITTAAGNGTGGYSGDGGAATNASLSYPSGVAVDGFGNVFIADSYNGYIRKVTDYGATLVVHNAGTGNAGVYGVVVTGPFGSVTNSAASLAVLEPAGSFRAGLSGGAGLGLALTAAAGQTYILQSTPSLAAPVLWQSIFTNTADAGGNWFFTNAEISNGSTLFYRVVAP